MTRCCELFSLQAVMKKVSPAGAFVSDSIRESLKDPEFRAEYERLAPYEELARSR